MADVTITIPDAQVDRVKAAFGVTTVGEFQDALLRHVKRHVLETEVHTWTETNKPIAEQQFATDRQAEVDRIRGELGL